MRGVDPAVVATYVTGLAAVFAAFWTVWDTRRSAWREALKQEFAVTKRTEAVLEVTIGSINAVLSDPLTYSSTIPWTAFSNLAGDIGVLKRDHIRIFVFIESLARDAEAAATRAPDKQPSTGDLMSIKAECVKLLGMIRHRILVLEDSLDSSYRMPLIGRVVDHAKEKAGKSS